ncbi:endonuclease domain-containing protein [Blastococcus sp. SYSU D00669]
MDFALYRTIARQGGVFTVSQALDSCSDAEVRRLVRSGRWRRSRWRGVLVDGDVPDSFAVQLHAASLLVGPDLVACHSTAARLWDFDVLGDDTLHFLGPPELVNRSRPGIRVHPSSLGTDDAVLVDGIWCTPAARTACDVVRTTPPIDGLATLDAALASGFCRREDLVVAAEAQAGLRHVVRLRRLVPWADRRVDSAMESRMRWRFLDAGFPSPDLQVRVPAEGRARWIDLGWREERVGAEFDGQEAHMTSEQLRDDRRRHNWLTENGWTLLHFTGHDVYRSHRQMLAVTARALRLPPRSWRITDDQKAVRQSRERSSLT